MNGSNLHSSFHESCRYHRNISWKEMEEYSEDIDWSAYMKDHPFLQSTAEARQHMESNYVPGPDLFYYSNLYQPIALIIGGKQNDGKSTLSHILRLDHCKSSVVILDNILYEAYTNPENRFHHYLKSFPKIDNPHLCLNILYDLLEQHRLYDVFLTHVAETIPSDHKLIMVESYAFKDASDINLMSSKLKSKGYRVWTVSRI